MATFPYAKDVGTHSYLNMEAFMTKSGIPFKVTSAFRPGSITLTGNVSYHARGNATDSVSSKANMVALAAWIEQVAAPFTLELIHSGGRGYFVHNGKKGYTYSRAIVNQHFDHVHWAITNSGLQAAGAAIPANIFVPTTATTPTSGCAIPAAASLVLIGGSVTWVTLEVVQRILG